MLVFFLVSFLAAILLHESGHIIAITALGGKIQGITPAPWGITVQAVYPPSYADRIVISLAGPFFGIVGFLVFRGDLSSGALFAEMNLMLSLFNLLPIATLDGGSALSAALSLFLSSERAETISKTVSLIFTLILWLISIYLFLFLNGSPSLFFLSLFFLFSFIFQR